MGLSTEQKKEALARNLPRRKQIVSRVRGYLSKAGLRECDLAERIDYSRSALNFFMNDRYQSISGDDSAISAALVQYMDSHPVSVATDATGVLYETGNVKLIRRSFERALANSCAYYFRGAPGCQKTFVVEHLIAELNRKELAKEGGRRAYYVRSRFEIRPGDMMKRVAMSIGVDSTGGIDRVLRTIRHGLRGQLSIIVVDEAQLLSIGCLEVLRELLEFPGVGLLFAGSHQLEDTFQRLDMAQWRSRIRKSEALPGLSEEEATAILRTELPNITASSVGKIISKSFEIDYYRGEKKKYLSARLLFLAIKEIHLRKQEGSDVELSKEEGPVN